ncbi:hypothetical protein [Rhizobium sp. SSA_523]|nr:hypothetical protein [Rhizobium sp. SSA_523]MCO5733293.1 hypothetical protein [Rhizobium sp. SSA_523]WKC21724.1 hypothetical protein QTJ18_07605 [Rhizobium sp. SSA_523]
MDQPIDKEPRSARLLTPDGANRLHDTLAVVAFATSFLFILVLILTTQTA